MPPKTPLRYNNTTIQQYIPSIQHTPSISHLFLHHPIYITPILASIIPINIKIQQLLRRYMLQSYLHLHPIIAHLCTHPRTILHLHFLNTHFSTPHLNTPSQYSTFIQCSLFNTFSQQSTPIQRSTFAGRLGLHGGLQRLATRLTHIPVQHSTTYHCNLTPTYPRNTHQHTLSTSTLA